MRNLRGLFLALLLSALPAVLYAHDVVIEWDANTEGDLAGYNLYRSTISGQSYALIATVGLVTTHTVTLPQLSLPATYYFVLTAFDLSGHESGYSNEVSRLTPGTPTQVTGVSATPASASSVLIQHSEASDTEGIAGYNYYRCAGANCTNFAQVAQANTLSYADTGLSAATLYRYQVRAQNLGGHLGTASATVDATTATAGPTTRRPLLTDPITRADNADLGTGWDAGYTGASAMKVVSNAVQGGTLAAMHMESDNTVTWPADQWVEVQLVSYVNGLSGGGPACRMAAPPTATAYWVDTNGSNKYVIRRRTAGTDTTIATSTIAAVSNGVLRLDCVGAMQTLYLNDVAIAAAADATIATGRAGMMLYVATSLSNTVFDNVGAGDYTSSTMPTITSATADATGADLTYGATTPTSVRVSVTEPTGVTDTVVTTATIAGGRTSLASDAFTRGDNADLGTNWLQAYDPWSVVSNAAQAPAVDSAMIENEASTLPSDQYAQVTLSAFGGAVDTYAGVRTRASYIGVTGYLCRAGRGTFSGTILDRQMDGATTQLGAETATVWAPSDVLRLESDGVTHRCYRNGTLLLTAEDAALASGFAGLWGYIAPGGTASDVRLDDFSSGGITPLDTNGRYTRDWSANSTAVCFIPRDSNGIENAATSAQQCVSLTGVVNPDTIPPIISNGAPTTELAAGTTSATESVQTNELARCRRSATDQAYGSMPDAMTTANGFAHTWNATGLVNNTTYTLYVRCTDQFDVEVPLPANVNTSSYSYSYSVAAAGGDTTAPSTVTGVSATAVSSARLDVTFTAATDNAAVIGYEGHLCSDAVCTTSQLINPTWSIATSQSIIGLAASTQYYIGVKAFDAAGNRSAAFSNVVAVTTPASVDLSAPSVIANAHISSQTYNSLTVAYDASTDNVGVKQYEWEFCEGVACTDFVYAGLSTGTTFTLAGLHAATSYSLRGKAVDFAGNASITYSDSVTNYTISLPTGVTQGVCPCRNRQR